MRPAASRGTSAWSTTTHYLSQHVYTISESAADGNQQREGMPLDRTKTSVPLYESVKQYILTRIDSGMWGVGALLPSEHELVARFGVSRMTVHRALRELSDKGIVSRKQGLGTFVSAPAAQSPLVEIRDIADDIVSRGHIHSARLISLEAVRADAELAIAFELRPGAKVFHSVVVHFEDELPVQLEERYVLPSFAPKYIQQDFSRTTTTQYLRSIAPATEVENSVFAVRPNARSCKLLEIDAEEVCLRMVRRTWVGATPTTKNVFTYPGSRYSLGSRYKVAEPPKR
jgi:GntR family histidine utilization transcriptional repressor